MTIVAATAPWLCGCGNASHLSPPPDAAPPSRSGAQLYEEAYQRWVHARSSDLRGDEWAREVGPILDLLAGAARNDPASPLYHGIQAELHLSLGEPDDAARASELFDRTYEISQDWIPFWFGKAELALRANDPAQAAEALSAADKAVESVARRASAVPVGAGGAPGGSADQLVAQLKAADQWSLQPDPAETTGRMLDRHRARLEFYHARVIAARKAPPAEVRILLDRSLRHDPNFIFSRLMMALMLRADEDFAGAEALLAPLIRSGNPLLDNNSELQFQLATTYRLWYKAKPDVRCFQAALRLYGSILSRHPDDVPALVGRAELLASIRHGGPDDGRAAREEAGRSLDAAARRGADAGDVERIRRMLSTTDEVLRP